MSKSVRVTLQPCDQYTAKRLVTIVAGGRTVHVQLLPGEVSFAPVPVQPGETVTAVLQDISSSGGSTGPVVATLKVPEIIPTTPGPIGMEVVDDPAPATPPA